MKSMVRLSFATLIGLAILIQVSRGKTGGAEASPSAALISGLQQMRIEVSPTADAGAVEGRSALCPQPLHAMLLRIDGADDEKRLALTADSDLVRYVYLGSVSDRRDRTGVMIRSALASASFVVGLRSSRPPPNLVVIALPRGCPALASLDWAILSSVD